MGDHAYKDFPNEKFSAWKVVTQLGSENVTDLRVLYKVCCWRRRGRLVKHHPRHTCRLVRTTISACFFPQDRPGGYSYHLYTDEQGQQRCSTGAQTQAANMLDFSWLGTSQITAGQNMTVQVPGKESPTLCIVYHEAQNPSHFACLVDLGGAKFAGLQQQQPVLHQDGSKQLFFTSFTPLTAENFPPSSPIFAAPGTCQSSQAPPPKPGTSWQVLLGSCVGAFLVGSGATLLVLYCRGRKREDDPRAYQAALLDVM